MLTLLRQLSLRHLVRAPLRSLLVVIGIALGVAMFVATSAANRSIAAAFAEMVQRVAGRADLVVIGRGAGIPGELAADVADAEGVAHAASAVEVPLRESRGGEPLLVLGVDFLGDTHFLPLDVAQGEKRVVDDPLAFVNDPKAILIARSLATRRGLNVGDPLELMTAHGMREFRVRGILDDVGPAAAFGGQVAIMFIDAAQVAFARGTMVDRIDVAVTEGADVDSVAAKLRERLGAAVKVEKPQNKLERIQKLMAPFRAGMALSGFVALIVGMFLIYNAVGIAVAQRRREIGILRSLGATRRRVVALFCAEALVLALPGIAFGLVLARFLAVLALEQTAPTVTRAYAPIRPPAPYIGSELMLQAVLVGLVTTLVAAFWPARRAARVDPVESLRPPSAAVSARHVPYRRMLAAGVGAILIGLLCSKIHSPVSPWLAILFVIVGAALSVPAAVIAVRSALVGVVERLLGVPGRLGLDNVERTLGRSALNVVALMVAVAMAVTIGNWLSSFKRNVELTVSSLVAGDMMITAGSPLTDQYNVPFSAEVLERLKGMAGVVAVLPTRVVEQDYKGETLLISGLDSAPYLEHLERRGRMPELAEGSAIEPGDLLAARRVVVNESAARRLGLHAGTPLEIDTPTGKAQFDVRAVVIDHAQGPVAFIDRKFMIESWKDDAIDIVDLVLAPAADAEAVASEVRKRLGDSELLFVTRLEAMTAEIGRTIDEAFRYARSVEIVTLVIALLGVVGTMTAAVLDRTRELGMLRAIGATRRQIARAVIVESGFLGFIAAMTGILAGTLMGWIFLRVIESQGLITRLQFVFSLVDMLRIGALVVVTAALAGLAPARRASRMDVKEALSYE